MVGSLANLAVLVAFGNAELQGRHVPDDFTSYGTFKFNEWTHFYDVAGNTIFAKSPSEYINSLSKRGVRGLMLSYGANTALPEGLSERMSAAFVGGGKQYLIQEFTDAAVNYVALQSEIGDREREDQRIWCETYYVYASLPRQMIPYGPPDINWATKNLKEALQATLCLCDKDVSFLRSSNWREIFHGALAMLDSQNPVTRSEYMDFPAGVLSDAQMRLLLAADHAWVFGGMCSWNDTAPADEALYAEYERVSERLYLSVNRAIVEAINETSTDAVAYLNTPISMPSRKRWWQLWKL
jgi:hypothetical protein